MKSNGRINPVDGNNSKTDVYIFCSGQFLFLPHVRPWRVDCNFFSKTIPTAFRERFLNSKLGRIKKASLKIYIVTGNVKKYNIKYDGVFRAR